MGNDGGSIPKRRELVKNAARNPNNTELKATLHESQTHAWTNCPLSLRPLSTPIVSDYAGTLYNKDAVIEHLLPSADDTPTTKTDQEEIVASRIKSLRDVVEVKFQIETDPVTKEEKKVCPITSKELGASTKAVYLVPCGHAFSEIAIKEVASEVCMSCNELYKQRDIISILPLSKDDINKLEIRIQTLKDEGLTHSLKKAPGSKKKKKQTVEIVAIEATDSDNVTSAPEKSKKRLAETEGNATAKSTVTASGGIKNAATASLTSKVMEEQEANNKRRKLGLNDNLKSLFSQGGANVKSTTNSDFMTRGFSIPRKA